MRLIFDKYKITIVSVFLLTVLYVAGWALAIHLNSLSKNAEPKKELEKDSQAVNLAPSVLDPNNILLVLVCIGLIGLFGVRRPSKASENIARLGHPEGGTRSNFIINESDIDCRTCQELLDTPDKDSCHLNMPCCV